MQIKATVKQKHSKNRFVPILVQLRGDQNLPTILCFGQGLVVMVTWNLAASGPGINVQEEVWFVCFPFLLVACPMSLFSLFLSNFAHCLYLFTPTSPHRVLSFESLTLFYFLSLTLSSSIPLNTYTQLNCATCSFALCLAHKCSKQTNIQPLSKSYFTVHL